jgi:hypothetical protein
MAASHIRATALNLYHWAKGNQDRIDQIRVSFDAAMSGPLAAGGMDSVTSATKNGVSMQKLVGLSETDRVTALRMAIDWLESGMPSSRTRVSFSTPTQRRC